MRRQMTVAVALGATAVLLAVLFAIPDTSAFVSDWTRYAHNEAVRTHNIQYVGGGPIIAIGAPDLRLLIAPMLAIVLLIGAAIMVLREHLQACRPQVR